VAGDERQPVLCSGLWQVRHHALRAARLVTVAVFPWRCWTRNSVAILPAWRPNWPSVRGNTS